MEKIIERNVPIAEENVTLSGQPATNMFEDWSENIFCMKKKIKDSPLKRIPKN
jgi:hypothetical protein